MAKDRPTWNVFNIQAQSGYKSDLIQGHDFLTGVVDLDHEILLNLSAKDLSLVRKTNKYALTLCSNKEFLRLRLHRNYNGNVNEALVNAAEFGDLVFVKYLLENGAKMQDYDNKALRLSSLNGHLWVVKYLIEKGANIHDSDDLALISAASAGHLRVVQYLVEVGANIHALYNYPLRMAAERGHVRVVQYLVEIGANIQTYGDAAIGWADAEGHVSVVKYLKLQMKI